MVYGNRVSSKSGRKRPRAGAGGDGADVQHLHQPKDPSHQVNNGEEDDEEERIRALVFGKDESRLLESFGAEADKGGDGDATSLVPESSDIGGFFEDHEGDASVAVVNAVTQVAEVGATAANVSLLHDNAEEGRVSAAWVDEDDAGLKVDLSAKNRLRKLRNNHEEADLTGPEFERRLRDRFTSSNLTVDWVKAAEEAKAKKSKKKGENANSMVTSVTEGTGDGYSDDEPEEAEDDDEDSALFKDSRAFKGHRGGVLEPGHLDIVRCKDANQHAPAKAVVRAVNFHPSGDILLVGGYDKTLRLFQVDGVNNPKMHSLFFEDLPITNAVFTGSDQAVITGNRPFFYWYDVNSGKVQKVPRVFSSGRAEKRMETFAASPDGRWLAFVGSGGYILLLANKTKQWVTDFKLNTDKATSVAFTPDSAFLLASGSDGNVFKFDLRSRRCVLRFFNEGGTSTTSLAMSPSSTHSLMAVGSDSGVVNVYGNDAFQSGKRVFRPMPLKAIMSLTTPATTTKFSPDGQMLAIASNQKRDGLKIIHSASCTPFMNWPTERTPIRYPFAVDFSPGGGFLAVGNDRGCVLLYRVRHYPKA